MAKKQPVGKLNFGGMDYADLNGADMSRAKGVQDVKVLELSNSFGWRGKWNFRHIDKVFLCYASDLSKVDCMFGAKVMSFYGAKSLPKVIDLMDTDEAYFYYTDFANVESVKCKSSTKLHGLDLCKNWHGKIKYCFNELKPVKDDFSILLSKIMKENQH